MSLFIIFSMND